MSQVFEQRWLRLGLILAVMLIAAWFRFWRLPDVPPGLEYDEAMEGFDAIWMFKTQAPYVFVSSVQGREALFLYPVALFTWLFKATPFTLRLTSAFAGLAAIPLLYRFALILFRDAPYRYWIGLVAAGGLAGSFWHVSISRVAFRAILLPIFFILLAILFWRGWQTYTRYPRRGFIYFCGAGAVLGLSQYTYFSARLLPVIFVLFVSGVWLTKKSKQHLNLGLGLLLMGLVSALVAAPLGLFFWHNPAAFNQRVDQVTFQLAWTSEGLTALFWHIVQAFRLFLGGADPRIRHHLLERPVFDGLTLVAFWIGTVLAMRQWRRPVNLFLLLSLVVLWLPAPLSVDPIHNLRAAGLLPAFYILTALGLIQGVAWGLTKILRRGHPTQVGLLSLGLIIFITGGINSYDYFIRWANHPLAYQEYKGPAIDLAQSVTTLADTADVIVPYNFYGYAPVHYVLQNHFREELALPFSPLERLAGRRPVIYVNPTIDERLLSSLHVWLTQDETGQGVAILTHALDEFEPDSNRPIFGRRNNLIGRSQVLNEAILTQIYQGEALVVTPFIWGQHIRLGGYELAAPAIQAGQAGHLTLYWQGLRELDLTYTVFIQILNERGEPMSQVENSVIKDDIQYYEDRPGFVAQQYLFWTGRDTPPGLYLLRTGLFNPKNGQRLPITTTTGQSVGDQIILAPFYVSTDNINPRAPDTPFPARLGQTIEIVGYTLSRPLNRAITGDFSLKLYWRATGAVDGDYTAFVQLLDAANQVVSQWDTPPVGGLYPTSRWSPGQIVVTEFPLSASTALTAGTYRLATGMYDLKTGVRLPAFTLAGQRWPTDMVILTQATLP